MQQRTLVGVYFGGLTTNLFALGLLIVGCIHHEFSPFEKESITFLTVISVSSWGAYFGLGSKN